MCDVNHHNPTSARSRSVSHEFEASARRSAEAGIGSTSPSPVSMIFTSAIRCARWIILWPSLPEDSSPRRHAFNVNDSPRRQDGKHVTSRHIRTGSTENLIRMFLGSRILDTTESFMSPAAASCTCPFYWIMRREGYELSVSWQRSSSL